MNYQLGLLFFVLTLLSSGCEPRQSNLKAPTSDLGHIDLILDSIDYYSIVNDTFLTQSFAVSFQDTVTYGTKQSYDLYLTGQENFLHISLAKGYWKDKAGSGVLVFQTRKPDMKDSLLIAWRQFYSDSLTSHVFNGPDFDLGEVMTYQTEVQDSNKKASFFSNLTSYSKRSLENWGFNDSAIVNGISMREFMIDWDSTTQKKFFKRILRLHVQLTESEYADLESALRTVGYSQKGSRFIHHSNPEISFDLLSEVRLPKFKEIEIELSQPTNERTFAIGGSYEATVKGTRMTLTAK
jgi:hypothetical protein